jgi:hypothetical protein
VHGFHADEDWHRWTNGLARLPDSLLRPFAGAFTLELRLASRDLSYQVPPPAPLDTAATGMSATPLRHGPSAIGPAR